MDIVGSDILSDFLSFSNAVPFPTSVFGKNVTWDNAGSLAPGANITIYLNASVGLSGEHGNNVSVTATPPNGGRCHHKRFHSTQCDISRSPPDDDDSSSEPQMPLELTVTATCERTIVTVTSDGDPVSSARVFVDELNLLRVCDGPPTFTCYEPGTRILASIFDGTTNASGQVSFNECSSYYRLNARKSGFDSVVETT